MLQPFSRLADAKRRGTERFDPTLTATGRGNSDHSYGRGGGQSGHYVRSRLINLQNRLCAPLLVCSW